MLFLAALTSATAAPCGARIRPAISTPSCRTACMVALFGGVVRASPCWRIARERRPLRAAIRSTAAAGAVPPSDEAWPPWRAPCGRADAAPSARARRRLRRRRKSSAGRGAAGAITSCSAASCCASRRRPSRRCITACSDGVAPYRLHEPARSCSARSAASGCSRARPACGSCAAGAIRRSATRRRAAATARFWRCCS